MKTTPAAIAERSDSRKHLARSQACSGTSSRCWFFFIVRGQCKDVDCPAHSEERLPGWERGSRANPSSAFSTVAHAGGSCQSKVWWSWAVTVPVLPMTEPGPGVSSEQCKESVVGCGRKSVFLAFLGMYGLSSRSELETQTCYRVWPPLIGWQRKIRPERQEGMQCYEMLTQRACSKKHFDGSVCTRHLLGIKDSNMVASKMAQRVRALAAKSDYPSSVPHPTLWKESTSKLSLTKSACKISSGLHTCAAACTCTPTHKQTNVIRGTLTWAKHSLDFCKSYEGRICENWGPIYEAIWSFQQGTVT